MKTNRFSEILVHWFILFMIGLATVMVILSVFGGIVSGDATMILLPLMILGVYWGFGLWILPHRALVKLCDEGIQVRLFFRKRLYPWSSIRQAGAVSVAARNGKYHQLVLVKENGEPFQGRKGKFLLHNFGKLIYINDTPEARAYIASHWGQLSFDLSR